jgi:UDPglucose 6-dehydrogenase
VLGLSYKPDTQVVEESQGIALAAQLGEAGYVVSVYDPIAMSAGEAILGDRVIFANDLADALQAADVAVVTTPWPEFEEAVLWLPARPRRGSLS